MKVHYRYRFLQIPGTSALIFAMTTDIISRYGWPRAHGRLAMCAGILAATATVVWQALLLVEPGVRSPRYDLLSMF